MKRHINLAAIRNAACAAALLISPLATRATDYTFTDVAGMEPFSFSVYGESYQPVAMPSVNNAGTVAFTADRLEWVNGDIARNPGVFTWSSSTGQCTPVVTSFSSSWTSFSDNPVINNNGTVAFTTYSYAGSGVLLGNASGGATTLYNATGGEWTSQPSINDNDTVTFYRSGASGESARICRGTAGSLTNIVTNGWTWTGQEYDRWSVFGACHGIDSDGTVAISGWHNDNTGVHLIDPLGNATTVAVGNFNSPAIENGKIAVVGTANDGWHGIYTGTAAGLALLAGTERFFDIQINININNSGDLAFLATSEDSVRGIYTGPTDKVIKVGDSLFDSVVTGLNIGYAALNDSGVIAFSYVLDNGLTGIALATPGTIPNTGEKVWANLYNWYEPARMEDGNSWTPQGAPQASDVLEFRISGISPLAALGQDLTVAGLNACGSADGGYEYIEIRANGHTLTLAPDGANVGALNIELGTWQSLTFTGYNHPQGTTPGGTLAAAQVNIKSGQLIIDSATLVTNTMSVGDPANPQTGNVSLSTSNAVVQVSDHMQVYGNARLSGTTLSATALTIHPGAQLSVSGSISTSGLSNEGQFYADGNVTINGPVAQVSGGTISGNWNAAYGTLTMASAGPIQVNEGAIKLSRKNTAFSNLQSLQENRGSLMLEDGPVFTTSGNLVNSSSLTVGGGQYDPQWDNCSQLHVQGDLVTSGYVSVTDWARYYNSNGIADGGKLRVDGTIHSTGNILLREGVIEAAAMTIAKNDSGYNGGLSGSGRADTPVTNISGTIRPEAGRTLKFNRGLIQEDGATMGFTASNAQAGFGRVEISGGPVSLGGLLAVDFNNLLIPQATLISFRGVTPDVHFQGIQAARLPTGMMLVPYSESGGYSVKLAPADTAIVRMQTNIGGATSVEEALPGFSFSAGGSQTGSISLTSDSGKPVIQLADTAPIGDSILTLSSGTLTLPDTLGISFSYRFDTDGKLQVLFHDQAGGADVLLGQIIAPQDTWQAGRGSYAEWNQYLSFAGNGAYNLSGHTGEILFRLSNSGDPVLNLASLEIAGTNVPEPAGATLLLMMSALGLRRRRRAA